MVTSTASTPARQRKPRRKTRPVHPPAGPSRPRLLRRGRITVGTDAKDYVILPVPSDFGRAFRLTKSLASMRAITSASAKRVRCATARASTARSGECKHVAGLKAWRTGPAVNRPRRPTPTAALGFEAKQEGRTMVVYILFTRHGDGDVSLLSVYRKSHYQALYNRIADIAQRHGDQGASRFRSGCNPDLLQQDGPSLVRGTTRLRMNGGPDHEQDHAILGRGGPHHPGDHRRVLRRYGGNLDAGRPGGLIHDLHDPDSWPARQTGLPRPDLLQVRRDGLHQPRGLSDLSADDAFTCRECNTTSAPPTCGKYSTAGPACWRGSTRPPSCRRRRDEPCRERPPTPWRSSCWTP